jgi:ABC-2 type transport system permease protein
VSTLVIVALVAIILRIGLISYGLSGGVVGMIALQPVIENPAVSALYGRVTSLPTAGAFVEWRMGMFLALAVALWAGMMATRVTRASEDEGTWDLLVTSARGRQPALAATISSLLESGVLVGSVTIVMFTSGSPRLSSPVLYGVATMGLAWTGTGAGLLASQFFAPRRSATQVALSAIAVAFIVRVIADGSTRLQWLRWLTPFGWMENVQAFHHSSPVWLLPLIVVPLALSAVAWQMQRQRDIGIAWWTRNDRSRGHEMLLRSPWRFAWRERWGMLLVWTTGLSVLGLVVGYLTNALVQLCRTDPGYVKLLRRWGLGSMVDGRGFIAQACLLLAVAISFMMAALLVSIGTDSYQGRLDLPLAYGTSRLKWLASAVLATAVATCVIAMVCALTMWLGVVASGTSMGILIPIEGMANALTMAPWLIGASVLLIAVLPRYAFLVVAMMLTVFYIDAILGPILHWPGLLLGASPFFHLHLVPVVASNWNATIILSAIGLVAGTLGASVFVRRDVGP